MQDDYGKGYNANDRCDKTKETNPTGITMNSATKCLLEFFARFVVTGKVLAR
jgi:hypothetical protein